MVDPPEPGRRTRPASYVVRAVVLLLVLLGTAACRDLRPDSGQSNRVSTVVYRVEGQGTADIRYAAGGGDRLTRVRGADLPWQGTAQVQDRSDIVYRMVATGSPGQRLSCRIEVNGVRILTASQEGRGKVQCTFIK